MTNRFVRSAATGTGDGSSWANAYTTEAAAVAASAAADWVYVADDHAEASASAISIAASNGTQALPINIVCVDHTVANPTFSDIKYTATVTGLTLSLSGQAYTFGVNYIASGLSTTAIVVAGVIGSWIRAGNGSFQLSNTGNSVIQMGGAGGLGRAELSNTYLKFAAAGQSVKCLANLLWRNTASVSAVQGTAPSVLFNNCAACSVRCEAVDLSAVTGTLVGSCTSNVIFFDFKDCAISSAVTIAVVPSLVGQQITTSRTDSSGTVYKTNFINYRGTQSVDASIVRTSGANDGVTSYSWKIATTANVGWQNSFEGIPIVENNSVTGANRTGTLRCLINAASIPTNDQIWVDLEYPGSATSGIGAFASGTKTNVLAAGTTLAADTSSAWDSNVGARSNSTTYTVGQAIKVASNPGRVFFCIATTGATASSEPAGFASAVDGVSVTDGGATFRAGCRCLITATASSPQPQLAGYVYAYVRCGATLTAWVDTALLLS